jgi:hypothetical protein
MLYPTFVEGFGLVPFEAANYGLATLSTRQGSLDEVLPKDIPTIESFDDITFAKQIIDLLDDKAERDRIVDRICETGKNYDAKATTDLLVEMFLDMTSRPPKRVAAIMGEDVDVSTWVDEFVKEHNQPAQPGRAVQLGWKLKWLKRIVSPNESRRQRMIRSLFNRFR